MNRDELRAAERYNEGNALLRDKHYAEALAAYDEVILLAPAFGAAYYNRGLARAYDGDSVGSLVDFRLAAIAGLDESFFYEAWLRHLKAYGGYRSVLVTCRDRRLPAHQRHALKRALDEALQDQSFLLREFPEAEIHFSHRSFAWRCAMGDLLRTRNGSDPQLIQKLLVEADAGKITDIEWSWRLHYLLGALFASTSLEIAEVIPGMTGIFFDADFVEDHAFFISIDSQEARTLDEFILRTRLDLNDLTRQKRFARCALGHFVKAAALICEARRIRLVPAASASLHWDIAQDLWRSYVDTCIYLKDVWAYSRAVASARQFNALVGLKSWFGDSHSENLGREADRVLEWYQPSSKAQPDTLVGDEELLLNYFVFERASDTIAYAVQPSSRQEVVATHITPTAVGDLVTISRQWEATRTPIFVENDEARSALRNLIVGGLSPEDTVSVRQLTVDLNSILLVPIQDAIGQASRLVIVPFGYLNNLPFHLLHTIREHVDNGRLREVVYVPAVEFLAKSRLRKPINRQQARYLFVGTGRAISYDNELSVVRSLFPHLTSLVGRKATGVAVLEALRDADVVHFACHGGFDPKRNCAYLQLHSERLYPGDLLSAGDISIDLVLLNACVTGVFGREARNGDASIGLPTAFLLAGARQVIGSLWPVNDSAALEFAVQFLNHWHRDSNASTAEIVLKTQRGMSMTTQFRDMYDWGSHAVFGDWR